MFSERGVLSSFRWFIAARLFHYSGSVYMDGGGWLLVVIYFSPYELCL